MASTGKQKGQKLSGLDTLAYMGVEVRPAPGNPPTIVVNELRPPTVNDYFNYMLGDLWLVNNSNLGQPVQLWILVALARTQPNVSNATWVQLFPGTGPGTTTYIENIGMASPVAGTINVLGDGVNLITNGAGNTITINLGGTVATQYNEDVGHAIPAGGILNVRGTAGQVATNGAGSTITISLNGAVATQYPTDVAGPAIPVAGSLPILGTAGQVTTTAIGNIVRISLNGAVALSFPTDAGVAIPAGGALQVRGAGGITTTGAGNVVTIHGAGAANNAAFQITKAGAATPNVTGDGTSYFVVMDTVNYDNQGGYSVVTGQYTVPFTGFYIFMVECELNPLTAAHVTGYIAFSINGGGGTFLNLYNVGLARSGGATALNSVVIGGSMGYHLVAGNTVQPVVLVAGSTRTVGVNGGGTSQFSGAMIFAG